jgi:hypothetical protein
MSTISFYFIARFCSGWRANGSSIISGLSDSAGSCHRANEGKGETGHEYSNEQSFKINCLLGFSKNAIQP